MDQGGGCIPSKDDSSSTLDVIVEDLLVLVPLEVGKGLLGLEVLELDDHIRVHIRHGLHELIHELTCLIDGHALMAEAKI